MMTKQEIMAVVKPAISNQLKSPASAQYPDELIAIAGDDLSGYEITGFVDSQNGYGAMLRNDFTATVSIEDGFPVVKSTTVGVKATKEGVKTFTANYILISILCGIGGIIIYFIISLVVEGSLPEWILYFI